MTTRARILSFIIVVTTVFAQGLHARDDEAVLRIRLSDRIRVSERSNLSIRVNGRYEGLLNRQVTGYLTRGETDRYEGRFFLYEQTRRDAQEVARPVDRSIEGTLRISESTLFSHAGAYPSIQELLSLPDAALRPGDRWQADALVTLDPRRDGVPLRLPVAVDYRYVGSETWNGGPAFRVEAQFATRFPQPPSDEPAERMIAYSGDIVAVRGTHELTIMIPAEGDGLFYRDELREEYRFSDGEVRLHEGHLLFFATGMGTRRQEIVAREVAETIRSDRVEGVTVERTGTGVRLTIDSLRFVADEPVLLPEERPRLDSVADSLQSIEGVRFLVVGHTADVGSHESQQQLSVARATLVAAELGARGVHPDRIDVEGRGGTDPVASNADEDGRARNRRVEIYVLEE